MKLATLAAALAVLAANPACADEVPYARPNSSGPPPTEPMITLGDIMELTEMRHIKLWFAARSENWDLAGYELNRIRDALFRAAMLYTGIPVEDVMRIQRPLDDMSDALKSKHTDKFTRAYGEATAACNSCHKAAGIGFVRIQTPIASPFSDEVFEPLKR